MATCNIVFETIVGDFPLDPMVVSDVYVGLESLRAYGSGLLQRRVVNKLPVCGPTVNLP